MNHTLSESQLEAMIKSAVNSSGPLPPGEKFSQLISALRELQERRNADSEPVGTLSVRAMSYNGKKIGTQFGFVHSDAAMTIAEGDYPLYRHAQPAPVVMDDTKLRELFDSWFASDCSFDLSPEASEADNIAWRESYWYVWQRCRAAMLNGGKP
ncbi:hypothetical protein [Klebsiella quasipneumoniae]|uniref:hypothetical protein n=1 Tax=Klebsiella quasipneumoniae TaxID=1463165 RepID=UPI00191E70AC|nr:hypothetical protein [Klebsiella quasipneumoniae]